jgi:tRNA pseudouridine38-40 synthase
VRTVQGELEAALATIYKEPVSTRAASRTDAGVHAEGQLVAFDPPFAIPSQGLLLALASRLPPDMSALAAWLEHDRDQGFVDPRRRNVGKHYRYDIRCARSRDPLARRTQWHLARRLDVASMQRAARLFAGTHDFASFRGQDCQAVTTERRIFDVAIREHQDVLGPTGDRYRLDAVSGPDGRPDRVEIHVRGLAFLKNMVRIMVGTLVEVGLGRRAPESIAELLVEADRTRAGVTAPPHGLTLVEVVWPAPDEPD